MDLGEGWAGVRTPVSLSQHAGVVQKLAYYKCNKCPSVLYKYSIVKREIKRRVKQQSKTLEYSWVSLEHFAVNAQCANHLHMLPKFKIITGNFPR